MGAVITVPLELTTPSLGRPRPHQHLIGSLQFSQLHLHLEIAFGTKWIWINSSSWIQLTFPGYLFSLYELAFSSAIRVRKLKCTLNKIKMYISHAKDAQGDESASHSLETLLPPIFLLHSHHMGLTS